MTALEELMERMAAKRALRERIAVAYAAGDMVEVERLWVEIEAG
jgi:hypothetical protein